MNESETGLVERLRDHAAASRAAAINPPSPTTSSGWLNAAKDFDSGADAIERLTREVECHRHMADKNYAMWSAATDERDVALELLSRVHQLGQTGGWRRMPGGVPFSATELATEIESAIRAAKDNGSGK